MLRLHDDMELVTVFRKGPSYFGGHAFVCKIAVCQLDLNISIQAFLGYIHNG